MRYPSATHSASAIADDTQERSHDAGGRARTAAAGHDTATQTRASLDTERPATTLPTEAPPSNGATAPTVRKLNRGISAAIPTAHLRKTIWLRALLTVNRFRVIRAVDVALACFPERPFKAALTAAQRAMRGLAKAGLVKRYRTDRFQHVYGLTAAGARWLQDRDAAGSSSVRRVSDMTNPEHQLWMNFITLACEARGVKALTESEALQELNAPRHPDAPVLQGFLSIPREHGERLLRPDVLAYEADGVSWFEIDRSKRGSDRESALKDLVERIGSRLLDGHILRRVVILAKTERVLKRALAVVRDSAEKLKKQSLESGGRRFREQTGGIFEVWGAVKKEHSDGRTSMVDKCIGYIVIQLIPTWLPKVRLDARNRHPLSGWLGENYLPYCRPDALGPWHSPMSPLLEVTPYENFCARYTRRWDIHRQSISGH